MQTKHSRFEIGQNVNISSVFKNSREVIRIYSWKNYGRVRGPLGPLTYFFNISQSATTSFAFDFCGQEILSLQ